MSTHRLLFAISTVTLCILSYFFFSRTVVAYVRSLSLFCHTSLFQGPVAGVYHNGNAESYRVSINSWDGFNFGSWSNAHPPHWIYPQSLAPTGEPVHILSFGDSVDRHVVDAGCQSWNGVSSDWADAIFRYREDLRPMPYGAGSGSRMCVTDWGSFSFLHMYGAAPFGPYTHGHVNSQFDPFADTSSRLPRALEHYVRLRGHYPSHVTYQSLIWDMANEPKDMNRSLAMSQLLQYMNNVQHNVRLLRSLLPPWSCIGIRTAPIAAHLPPRPSYLNEGLRKIAGQLRVPLLDYQQMVATAQNQSAAFRDGAVHPSEYYAAIYANHVVRTARAGSCGLVDASWKAVFTFNATPSLIPFRTPI